MRDVNNGWAVRYTHANVASFFFIFVYAQYCNINIKLLNYQYLNNLFYNLNYIDYMKPKIITDFINIIKGHDGSCRSCRSHKNSTSSCNKTTTKIVVPSRYFIQWFVGFSDAEGAFMINTKNNKDNKPIVIYNE